MVPKDDSQGWRFALLIFQSHTWHLSWNKFDVRKRALLKMKKGSRCRSVICLLHCQGEFSNPRIKHWTNSAWTRTRCTVQHLMMSTHKQGLILVDHHLPTICEKTGKDIKLFFVSTQQCSILFNNLGSFNRKSEFWKPENLNKPSTKGETINIADLSFTQEFLEKQLCSCYLDVRGGQFADRHMAVAWRRWLGGMPFSQKQWTVSSCKK